MFILYSTAALLIGFVVDLLIGDPHGWPHIVRGMGWLISALEKVLYPMKNKRLGGVLLVIFTLLICAGLPAVLLYRRCLGQHRHSRPRGRLYAFCVSLPFPYRKMWQKV